MFIIESEPKFTHAVEVQVPVDGGFREDSIKATYRVLPVDQVESYDLTQPADAKRFLQAVIVKLEDIVDPNKQPISYSDELRDRVLDLPYARVALASAYFDAVTKAKSGN